VILYAGRIDWTKGVDVLVDAFNVLASGDPDVHLAVAGGPDIVDHTTEPSPEGVAYLRRLKALVPPGRSSWLGSQLDVRPLYQAADVAVVPSRSGEAFARAVIEPMSCGIPVLASTDGGTPEAIGPRFDRFLFEPNDTAALLAKLEWIRDWRERDPRLADACREHVMENFPLSKTLDSLERVFAESL
jgi:glycosyltransferase involved in cell wall biosynthesis